MKIIETRYNGYNFRSRTEARWAVYFVCLGWKFEYEKEGYIFRGGVNYLPDFYFPELNIFAEVKGGKFTEIEKNKCFLLSKELNCNVLLLDGAPDFKQYEIICNFQTGQFVQDFMFIERGGKYYPIFYSGGELCEDLLNVNAVNISRSKRFEFL